jgi:hypothetical protein
MTWKSVALPCLLATAIVGCGGRSGTNRETGAVSGAADTASIGNPATGAGDSMAAPSTPSTNPSDSNLGNGAPAKDQTQSGVTDSSGKSTLGKGVKKTRPDQGQPVTSKGDTISGRDSTGAAPK